jgi:hypothetical protein
MRDHILGVLLVLGVLAFGAAIEILAPAATTPNRGPALQAVQRQP